MGLSAWDLTSVSRVSHTLKPRWPLFRQRGKPAHAVLSGSAGSIDIGGGSAGLGTRLNAAVGKIGVGMLSRSERFRIVSAVSEELEDWPWTRIEALYLAFGVTPPSPGYDISAAECLISLDDNDLVELSKVVFGTQHVVSAGTDVAAPPPSDAPWSTDGFRLFISHSADHKSICGSLATSLGRYGIEGFVAHDSMKVTRPWQTQIEVALQTMDALLVLCHPETVSSAWCQQEIGWALGRGVPYFVVRMGADPKGFVSHQQWPSHAGSPSEDIASAVVRWASGLSSFPRGAPDRLLEELEVATSFDAAAETAKHLCQFQTLRPEQLDRIVAARQSNSQLSGKNSTRELRTLYVEHGLQWTD